MNVNRKTYVGITLSPGDLIAALKVAHPHDLNIQTVPTKPTAADGKVFVKADANGYIRIDYTKETTVPSTAALARVDD